MSSSSNPPPSQDPDPSIPFVSPAVMADVMKKAQGVAADFLARHAGPQSNDMSHLIEAFGHFYGKILTNPLYLYQSQLDLWKNYIALWQRTSERMLGTMPSAPPVATPEAGDKRFSDPLWQENALFDFIKQSYLLTSHWVNDLVKNVEGLDDKTAQKIAFYTKQLVDAASPTNFAMTNPAVLRETLATGGENLVKGLQNLLADLERGDGQLSISMTDYKAFEVGKNLATTPGKVVFEDPLFQLIQYAPSTKTVFKVPLLIIPPWINKFYILDLQAKNSFIKWAVDQGHTVFIMSWANPGPDLVGTTFDDYMMAGYTALKRMESLTGEPSANVIGYCIGGTALAGLLAWLKAKKEDKRVTSATFFTTLMDFSEPGDLGVFIDEPQVSALEKKMAASGGFLDGRDMATTFNLLRSNDLIWSFVVNNYMMGKEPFPFDLLYWNSDFTRLPAKMHSFYLRSMYMNNLLIQKHGLTLGGVPIDLRTITTPSYWISTREDHIAPWRATYAATQLFAGEKTFLLAGSGHIAGIINPPEKQKYGYWMNKALPPRAEDWLKDAVESKGSWWPQWQEWAAQKAGEQAPPRTLPTKGEDAPGRYVRVR